MSMFILAISCLTTSNLLWFTDLTFQVSIHIVLYSIRLAFHHQPQPQPQLRVISALGQMLLSFWYFFLAILVNVRPSPSVAYWTSSILGEGGSSSRVLPFCLFVLFMGFSWQECWSGLPFPPLVKHSLFVLFMGFPWQECWSGLPFPPLVKQRQDSSLWLACLRWPCTAWVRAWGIQAPPPWQGCDPWRGAN